MSGVLVERNEFPTRCQGPCNKYFGAAEILRCKVNRAFRSLCVGCFEAEVAPLDSVTVKPPRNWPTSAPLPALRRGHVSSTPTPPAGVPVAAPAAEVARPMLSRGELQAAAEQAALDATYPRHPDAPPPPADVSDEEAEAVKEQADADRLGTWGLDVVTAAKCGCRVSQSHGGSISVEHCGGDHVVTVHYRGRWRA